MPAPRRIARLKQLILETAAVALQREMRDPRLGFVTVTRVDLAPDLTQTTVYWSALGTEAERRTSERALADARPVLQAAIARAMATRTTPVLSLRYDPTLAEAEKLEGIFEKIKRERPAPAETPAASSPRTEGDGTGADREDAEPDDDRAADDGTADDRATDEESPAADDAATDEAGEDEEDEKHRDPE